MVKKPDIAITTRQGRPLAVVQVKNLPALSLEDAVELRDGVVEQLAAPVPYVLVVSQDKGFIWRRQDNGAQYGQAEEFDMRAVVRQYLSDDELSRHIRGADLDLIISHWLADFASGGVIHPAGVAEQGPFVDFLSDIRGARINLEALA